MSNCLRAAWAALLVLVALAQPVHAQVEPPAVAASGQSQFPQIPLRRDTAAGPSMGESVGWTVLVLVALAGAGLVLVRRRAVFGARASGWLRPEPARSSPKLLARTALTPQASLHVVEWQGEELLLGCTPQTMAVLARRPTEPSKESA